MQIESRLEFVLSLFLFLYIQRIQGGTCCKVGKNIYPLSLSLSAYNPPIYLSINLIPLSIYPLL